MKKVQEKTHIIKTFYLGIKENEKFEKDMQRLRKKGISMSRFVREFLQTKHYKEFLKEIAK